MSMMNKKLVEFQRPDGSKIMLPPKKVKAFLTLFKGMSAEQIAVELSMKYIPRGTQMIAVRLRNTIPPNQISMDFGT